MATEIRVPTLGESVTEATIGGCFKQPGESVAADEPVVELETDKVTVEVPAPASGVLAEIVAKDGETVAPGALLGQIREGAAAKSAPATPGDGKPAGEGAFSKTARAPRRAKTRRRAARRTETGRAARRTETGRAA